MSIAVAAIGKELKLKNEQKTVLGIEVSSLIDDFMKVYEEFRDPSNEDIEMVEQVEAQLGSVVGQDRPDKIAGNLAFFRLSRLLYPDEKLTMTELSEKLMIEKYSATRLISWWVDRGLAERLGDPNDRRIVRVALTKKGKQFHKTIQSIALRRLRQIFQRLTAEELAIFSRLFHKLAARTSTS